MSMYEGLRGKAAIVTGAGRGNGEAIARSLACTGVKVLVADISGDEKAVAESIGGDARAQTVDILVNNAAIDGTFVPAADCSIGKIRQDGRGESPRHPRSASSASPGAGSRAGIAGAPRVPARRSRGLRRAGEQQPIRGRANGCPGPGTIEPSTNWGSSMGWPLGLRRSLTWNSCSPRRTHRFRSRRYA
jgi:hypothetical protein